MNTPQYQLPPLVPYGFIRKSRGYSGEFVLSLHREAYIDLDPEYLFLSIDNIPVPFRVLDLRGAWDNLIVSLEDMDDSDHADQLRGLQVLVDEVLVTELLRELPDNSTGLDLLGYQVIHPATGLIGTLEAIDTSTPNTLLLLATPSGDELCLPFVDQWVKEVDPEACHLEYDCPQDLLTLS